MILFLQVYFIISSIFLFVYASKSDNNASFSFGYGIAINIFPLVWMPYYSMDMARFFGVPLAYLPILAAGFVLIKRNNFKILKEASSLLQLSIIFIVYTFFSSLILRGFTFKNFAYWFAWILNFIIFFSSITFFAKRNILLSKKVIKSTTLILIFGCLTGILRYLSGVSIDSNFMPVVNRNGTVVIIVLFTPLLFYLFKIKALNKSKFLISIFILLVCTLLTFSRSGLIGVLLGFLLYYSRLNIKGLIAFVSVFIVLILIVYTGIFDDYLGRLFNTFDTLMALTEGEEFNNSMADYNRIQLLQSALDIIENNFLFGTGLGLENYRKAFHEVSHHFHDSKSHNFYLSYFAELGLIGFTILILFFRKIYKSLLGLNSEFRAFKISFILVAVMMTMNEYILLPELWFFFGMLAGISFKKKRFS